MPPLRCLLRVSVVMFWFGDESAGIAVAAVVFGGRKNSE